MLQTERGMERKGTARHPTHPHTMRSSWVLLPPTPALAGQATSHGPGPTWMQGEDRPCCRWLYSVSINHCSCAVRLGSWLDIIPNTSTWLGFRGADRKRSSSKSDTNGAFTIHLQPARMSSLRMSLRSTSGQSEGEAAHLVGLRISLDFLLQKGEQW